MKIRRIIAFLICLMFLVTAFSGCGGSAESKSEAPESTEIVASSEDKDTEEEKIKLKLMMIWLPDEPTIDAPVKYSQIDKFLEANPNVEIQNDSIAHDDFVVKIKAMIAANEIPDVWSARGDMVPPAVDNELIYTTDEILAQVDGWRELFDPSVFSDFLYNGEYWNVPAQLIGCSYLFCNMDILNDCGVSEPPATWDELLDAIAKVKAKGLIPICAGNKGKTVIGDSVMSWLCDRYTGTDWFYSMKEKKGARFTDPQFVAALTALKELVDAGAFNEDANSLDEDMGRGYYLNREAAMFFSGAWSVGTLENFADEELVAATRVVLPPIVEGAVGKQNAVSGGAGWGYAISNQLKGEKFKKAAELVYYLTNDDYARGCLKGGSVNYPGITPEDADFSNIGPLGLQYMETLKHSIFCPDYYVLMEPAPLDEFGTVVQEILIGTTTPEEGAKRIDDAYEQYVINK